MKTSLYEMDVTNTSLILFIISVEKLGFIYFLKQKFKAYEMLKNFVHMLRSKVVILLKLWEFEKAWNKYQLRARYISRQNGIVKRKKKTIKDTVRSMLQSYKKVFGYMLWLVLSIFWTSALLKNIHDINTRRSMEWMCLSNLRMFSCISHLHIPNELRKKLKGKVEKCIFISYSL